MITDERKHELLSAFAVRLMYLDLIERVGLEPQEGDFCVADADAITENEEEQAWILESGEDEDGYEAEETPVYAAARVKAEKALEAALQICKE